MTIPTSVVPTAITNLLSALQTQVSADTTPSGSSPILLCRGEPGKYQPEDIISVGRDVQRAVKWETFIGSAATSALEESFVIEVICRSWTGDDDPTTNQNRAWTLVGYVETAVRTDPSLGGIVNEAHPSETRGGDSAWTDSPTGRECSISVSVHCTVLN